MHKSLLPVCMQIIIVYEIAMFWAMEPQPRFVVARGGEQGLSPGGTDALSPGSPALQEPEEAIL